MFVGQDVPRPERRATRPSRRDQAHLECRAPHYKGTVKIVFDGSRDSVMCTATRLKICVEGLKNPFDDCEVDPSQTP